MKPRIEVEVNPSRLTNVYADQPGYVSTYDAEGALIKRRAATEQEALQELTVQRIETAVVNLEIALNRVTEELVNLQVIMQRSQRR